MGLVFRDLHMGNNLLNHLHMDNTLQALHHDPFLPVHHQLDVPQEMCNYHGRQLPLVLDEDLQVVVLLKLVLHKDSSLHQLVP